MKTIEKNKRFTDDLGLFGHLLDFAGIEYCPATKSAATRLFSSNTRASALLSYPTHSYLSTGRTCSGLEPQSSNALPLLKALPLLRLLQEQMHTYQHHVALYGNQIDAELPKSIYVTLSKLAKSDNKKGFIDAIGFLDQQAPHLLNPDYYREIINSTREMISSYRFSQ